MPKVPNSTEEDSSDTMYYRSRIAGLSVVVGSPDPTKGEVAHPTVDFVPYWEELKGVEGRVKVGYLKTDNGSAIKKLNEDINVEQISKEEYEDATKTVLDAAGQQIAGIRAAY